MFPFYTCRAGYFLDSLFLWVNIRFCYVPRESVSAMFFSEARLYVKLYTGRAVIYKGIFLLYSNW